MGCGLLPAGYAFLFISSKVLRIVVLLVKFTAEAPLPVFPMEPKDLEQYTQIKIIAL
jgi:hypothetical protein